MAVEEDRSGGGDVAHERKTGGKLVYDEGARVQSMQFAGKSYVHQEMDVAEDGAEDCEAGEDGHGDEPVSTNTDVEGSYKLS